jgi:hypothetical protein
VSSGCYNVVPSHVTDTSSYTFGDWLEH